MGKQIPDNTELSVQELVDNAKILSQHTFRSENLIQNFNNLNIDPLARNKTQKWEMAVGTVMYAISGQIPDRVDILRGRQIIERLPKTVKSDVDLHFVLAYLPYLLVDSILIIILLMLMKLINLKTQWRLFQKLTIMHL